MTTGIFFLTLQKTWQNKIKNANGEIKCIFCCCYSPCDNVDCHGIPGHNKKMTQIRLNTLWPFILLHNFIWQHLQGPDGPMTSAK